ncbi:MAG: DUF2851 family protein, partial [Verrucomicrobiota bacterium]
MISFFPGEGDRYRRFRQWVYCEAEEGSVRLREPWAETETELEIQARWFAGEFGRKFTGVEGETIEIVQFGHWNRGAGPDFTETAVRIDGKLQTGAIELDLDARDWEGHRHGENPEFDSVVLHVFTNSSSWKRFYTRTVRHRNVTQLQLPQYAWTMGPPDFLPEAFPGRCVAPLKSMTNEEVESLLHAAAQFRLREKAERLRVMALSTSSEQALFQAAAEALGFRQNKIPMAVLAQRCPINELKLLPPLDREAQLFGVAGFLGPEWFEATEIPESRRYLRRLWDRWWQIRDNRSLSPERSIPWKFSGSRPFNHPQRRVGALASLANDWEPFRKSVHSLVNNLADLVNNSLNNLQHPYWDTHYTLSSTPIAGPVRLLGKDRVRDLLGNVVFPRAIGLEPDLWDEYRRLRSVDSNQKIRRAGLRLFGSDDSRRKLFTRYYHQQQGLLQIYRDF